MSDIVQTEESNVVFYSVEQFKLEVGCQSLQVMKRINKENDKVTRFVSTSNGKVFKTKLELDLNKPLAFLIPGGVIEDACLVNVNNTVEVQATL